MQRMNSEQIIKHETDICAQFSYAIMKYVYWKKNTKIYSIRACASILLLIYLK